MYQLHRTSPMPLTPAQPACRRSTTYKLIRGLIAVILLAVLAKLLSIWGHDYIQKAHDSLCDSLWLNEHRGMA